MGNNTKLLQRLVVLAGKDGFVLDETIGIGYLVNVLKKYGFMMLRGRLRSFGKKGISNSLFVGENVVLLNKKTLKIGPKVKLHDNVYIDALSKDGVEIGENVVLGRNSRIECTGSLNHVGKGISIGNNSSFGNDCFFGAAGGISIGSDVLGGQYIRFHSENHNFSDKLVPIKQQGVTHEGITIGDDCWLGSGSVFLDGVTLGKGCVVGANAVVTKSFPEYSVIAGNPAKLIKQR